MFAGLITGSVIGLVDRSFGQPSRPDSTYLSELIADARAKGLAQSREWQVLMHYRKPRLGGLKSEADGPGFFLAHDGKYNSEAELEATLAAFFSETLESPDIQHPQCRFVARYQWLKASLGFDPTRLSEQECIRFRQWVAALDPESVTFVFPSAYLNNPSSMFGHTLLRIDRKGRPDTSRLLDYTINFAADTNTPTSLRSIILGVSGGLPGRFSITPYYVKTREYTDIESRDIWEYRLTFTEGQIARLLAHAWEMGTTYFDYYFFDENCSYHLLSLLDAADPSLHLTEQFTWWTIPSDTIRALLNSPGLVDRISYRPARETEVSYRRSRLRHDEEPWLFAVLRNPAVLHAPDFMALPDERRALILDVASGHLAYRLPSEKGDDADRTKALQRDILLERAALRIASDESSPPAPPPPETGHGTARVGLGGGRSSGQWFGQLALRPALHDLLGDESGYARNTHLEFMNTVLRYNRASGVNLNRLDVIRIISLTPYNRLVAKPSWQISTGFFPVEDLAFRDRSAPSLDFGIGGAAQSRWWRREVWYLLGELAAQYGAIFDERYRAGPGATGGLLFDLTAKARAHAFASYRAFLLGDRSSDLVSNLELRYTLSKDWDVRAGWKARPDWREALISVNAYF
ncbi:MAG: DUF4105 domain-containing protein [Nitrospirota bacterium]